MIQVTGVSTYVGRSRRPVQSFAVVTGVAELDRTFQQLARDGQNRAVRSAMSKSLRVLTKAIRDAVPQTRIAGHRRQSVQQAVNWRFRRNPTQDKVEAKSGGGVGMKANSIVNRKGKARGGVGITGRNIHWYILGTKKRWTGSVTRRLYRRGKAAGFSRSFTGKRRAYRGFMPAFRIVKIGAARAEAQVRDTFVAGFREALEREVVKAAAKAGSGP